jgi:hypothetical protein
MSPLAIAIFRELRKRVRRRRASVTYAELARSLGRHRTHHRARNFHAALGEIALACRHAGLPCLPAIVWRADTSRPSAGYYAVAHPRVVGDGARRAWECEHERVVRAAARYPPRL